MAAVDEVKARTGLDETAAAVYVTMAEERVRLYLNYTETDDLSRFSSAIADVAVSLYDRQQAEATAKAAYLQHAGKSGTSYTEGPVSVHETYAQSDGWAGVTASYDAAIKSALKTLDRFRRVRVVTC